MKSNYIISINQSNMNNSVYILEDRALLYISGEEAQSFLQNLITNDINKVTEKKSCFASLLTPQGKFLYEFFIIKHKLGYFVDCEKSQAENLFNQLNIYKIRSKIDILNLSNEFVVVSFDKNKFLSLEKAKDEPGNTIKFREDPIFLDPRNSELGARLIINLEKLYLSLKKLGLKDDNIEKYYEKSFNLGINPKNLNDLQNKLFGIEYNLEELNAIDFKKGCYVGQENTARIKLKDKLSKRLLPLKVIDGNIEKDEAIFHDEKEIGKILINDKKYPFGLIKFKEADLKSNLKFKTKKSIIEINLPKWIKI